MEGVVLKCTSNYVGVPVILKGVLLKDSRLFKESQLCEEALWDTCYNKCYVIYMRGGISHGKGNQQ
jgi:hypothetical protein